MVGIADLAQRLGSGSAHMGILVPQPPAQALHITIGFELLNVGNPENSKVVFSFIRRSRYSTAHATFELLQ